VEEVTERLPLAEGTFDVVFARAVLHHTRDLELACSEMYRVLRPGGILMAAREHVISKPEHLSAFQASHPLHSLYGGENAFTLKEYLSAFRAAGFTMVIRLGPSRTPINYYPTTENEHDNRYLQFTSRVLGAGLSKRLLRQAPIRAFWFGLAARVEDALSSSPGRMYTFVCGQAGGQLRRSALQKQV